MAIVYYNMNMGNVDGVNQMVQYYPVTRRTIKWVKKLFWFFMQIALHNSHVIYNEGKESKKEKTPLLKYMSSSPSACLMWRLLATKLILMLFPMRLMMKERSWMEVDQLMSSCLESSFPARTNMTWCCDRIEASVGTRW